MFGLIVFEYSYSYFFHRQIKDTRKKNKHNMLFTAIGIVIGAIYGYRHARKELESEIPAILIGIPGFVFYILKS